MTRSATAAVVCILAWFPVQGQDTLRIRADNAPMWGPGVSLTRIFALGSVDGPVNDAFGKIRLAVPRGDHGVFVYDEQDVQIRLYDANGKFVKAVGRKGAGPGEYADVVNMAVVGDSVLVVGDHANGRVTYFTRDGVFIRTVPLQYGPFATSRSFAVDAAGRIYVQTVGASREPGVEPPSFYVRSRPSGQIVDSLAIPPRNAQRGFVVELTSEGERWNFMPSTVFALSPAGGVVSARSDRIAIAMPLNGRAAIVERAHTPVPVTAAERAEWEATIRNWDAVVNGGRAPSSRPPIPDVKPALRNVVTDGDGRVWIEVYTTATRRAPNELRPGATIRAQITWREVTTFEVLSASGQYLGRVVLPNNSVLLAARGNRVWLRTEGESGEHLLTSYRLVGRGL